MGGGGFHRIQKVERKYSRMTYLQRGHRVVGAEFGGDFTFLPKKKEPRKAWRGTSRRGTALGTAGGREAFQPRGTREKPVEKGRQKDGFS